MKRLLSSIVLTALSLNAAAQDLLITNATLHTGENGEVIESADILIKDGEIEKISARIRTNESITVVDAAGRHVTPAFFAGATVTGLSEVGAVRETVDSEYEDLFTDIMHPEFDIRPAYNPHTSVIPITRVEGFGYSLLTATRGDRSISGQGGLVRFDGGYDSFEGKPVIFVEVSGHAAGKTGGSRAVHWMLLKQAFGELQKGVELDLLSPIGRDQLRNATKSGVFVFNTNRATDIMQVIKFAKTHNIEAVIHGGREAWLVADALAQANVPVMLNALENLPADFDSLAARLDNAALLHKAGVTLMFTSGETHNARKVRQVAGSAVANGLPLEAAIAALTSVPAEVFGARPRAAKRGAIADLVIWSGDPVEVTTLAQLVIMGGKIDSMESRQTKLRDRYLAIDPALPRAYLKP